MGSVNTDTHVSFEAYGATLDQLETAAEARLAQFGGSRTWNYRLVCYTNQKSVADEVLLWQASVDAWVSHT